MNVDMYDGGSHRIYSSDTGQHANDTTGESRTDALQSEHVPYIAWPGTAG